MKTTILILAIILTACEIQPVIQDIPKGGVILTGSTPNLQAAKTPPLCSDQEPTIVEYVLMHENGTMEGIQAAVTIVDNEIIQSEPVELPIGIYTVLDISLLSSTGTLTHAIPEDEPLEALNWGSFVTNPLPFDIEVLPDQTTNVNGELICYTSQILDLNGFVDGLKILDLKTLYWEMPRSRCIERVTIDTDGKRIYDFTQNGGGIRGTPIIAVFNEMIVTAWDVNDVMVDEVIYTNSNYNPDNQITYADVVQFSCP